MKYKEAVIIFSALVFVGTILILNACGISPDDKTEVKILISKDFLNSSKAQRSAQTLTTGEILYHLIVRVTAPDLAKPIIFTKPKYEPGTDFEILLPNGKKRTFDVLMYEEYKPAPPSEFPATLWIPSISPLERTFDLVGKPLVLEMALTQTLNLADIGTDTNANKGFIWMETSPQNYIPIPECGNFVELFFQDLEMPEVWMGPVVYTLSGTTGSYNISWVPVGRPYKIIAKNKALGWDGGSNIFLLDGSTSFYPVDIYLSGFKPLSPEGVAPDNLLVKDGDTQGQYPFSITSGWGAYDVTNLYSTSATINPEMPFTYYYQPVFPFGADIVDSIIITDMCYGSSVRVNAYVYLAPDISDVYPPVISTWASTCYPQTIYVYGSGFDTTNSVVLIDDSSADITIINRWDYEIDFELAKPRSQGIHTIKVINPESNPLFPNFTGFSSNEFNVQFADTSCAF